MVKADLLERQGVRRGAVYVMKKWLSIQLSIPARAGEKDGRDCTTTAMGGSRPDCQRGLLWDTEVVPPSCIIFQGPDKLFF